MSSSPAALAIKLKKHKNKTQSDFKNMIILHYKFLAMKFIYDDKNCHNTVVKGGWF